MRHKPLGDTKKLKKDEQVLICRGIKYEGKTELLLEDGQTASIVRVVKPFKYVSDQELLTLNIGRKTKAQVLAEIRKDSPDFNERELVTLIFVNIDISGGRGGGGGN